MVNVIDIVYLHNGRDQSGPYDAIHRMKIGREAGAHFMAPVVAMHHISDIDHAND